MKGYKGFDRDWKCKGLQYKVGEKVDHKGDLKLCSEGLHFCENALDVLMHYGPATSKYAEVEADGVLDQKEKDSKRVAKSLIIKAELSLKAMIKASVKLIFSKSEKPLSRNSSHAATSGYSSHAATSGDYSPAATSGNYSHAATSGDSSHAATSGYSSHAATSGDYSHAATSGDSSPAATSGDSSPAATSGYSSPAATSGDYSPAATSGQDSIAASIGMNSMAKAAKGSWIVCAEYNNLKVECVRTAKIDGKKLKADTLYKLKDGKFVEVK